MSFRKSLKILLFSVLLFSQSLLFADVPDQLYGIWEGKDRYVFFEENQIVIVLKTYYGWYLDRVVEDPSVSEKYKRDRNTATTKKSVYVITDSKPLWISEGNSDDSSAYELKLEYGKHDVAYVPFAVINDQMFLKFWISDAEHPGFWAGNAVSEGILVSNQVENENLWSWFIDSETGDMYKLRYWKSKMDFDPDLEAIIKSERFEDTEYTVQKHIFSAQNVYTCVPGRRVYIRNLDKTPVDQAFDGKDVLYNEETTICAVNDVYLKKLADKKTLDDLIEIVRTQNSKRKPDPEPLFPPEELDYHWDLIDYLESGNQIIQVIRQRQRDFGVRGKDLGR
ncbi:MAG: hypothetical protein MJ181_11180 [Treponema sp.]|nr:hypothetical protein [Treponema sp.]